MLYMSNKTFAAVLPQFKDDYLLVLNKETGQIEDDIWTLTTIWPFELKPEKWHNIDNKYYYETYYGRLIPEEKLYEVSEEEYKELIFDRESSSDEVTARFIDISYQQNPKGLGEELIKAFCNRIDSVRNEWSSSYCDFIDKCITGVAKSEISVMWAEYNEDNKEIQIHVSLAKPGYFIGKCGEIIDFWTARIKNLLRFYNPEFKFSFRLHEYAQITFRETSIRL